MAKSIKNAICKFFYYLLYRLDKKHIDSYAYETFPYCGHYYSGHYGKYTRSSYLEGMGACEARLGWLLVVKNSEESDWSFIIFSHNAPVISHKVISSKPLVIECINFEGFIGGCNGTPNKWFDGLKPFANGKSAWHFLGFRFTKSLIHNCISLNKNQFDLLQRYNKLASEALA